MKRSELLDAALAEEDNNKLRTLRDLFEMECSVIRSYYDEIINAGRAIETFQKSLNIDPRFKDQINEMRTVISDRINKIKTS